jgi:hypothetical protein
MSKLKAREMRRDLSQWKGSCYHVFARFSFVFFLAIGADRPEQ